MNTETEGRQKEGKKEEKRRREEEEKKKRMSSSSSSGYNRSRPEIGTKGDPLWTIGDTGGGGGMMANCLSGRYTIVYWHTTPTKRLVYGL